MKKISEFRNEEALDLLVDIIEPTARIFGDAELRKAVLRKAKKIECIKIAIKNHKSDVIEILALLDGEDPKKYDTGLVRIITKLLEVLNDEELSDFFKLQGQMVAQTSLSSVTENTEASAQ